VDHGFGAVWVGFVVAGEASVVHEPSEGPLGDPGNGTRARRREHNATRTVGEPTDTT